MSGAAHDGDAGADRAAFEGLCALCGARGRFEGAVRGSREQFPCPKCRATHRYREQAAAILTVFARGRSHFLDHFVRQPEASGLLILEAAIRGPFIRRFATLPGYVRCYLFEDLAPGEVRDGVRCENLERTTFADESFDLVVTSDVMEHVFDVESVVAETRRVLRPGGAHVFSVPLRFPLTATTAVRARLGPGGEVEHLAPPHYHRSGLDEPSLLVSEFGADLLDLHRRHGLHARFFRGAPHLASLRDNAAVVARRLA